jgi:hypothetical protein
MTYRLASGSPRSWRGRDQSRGIVLRQPKVPSFIGGNAIFWYPRHAGVPLGVPRSFADQISEVIQQLTRYFEHNPGAIWTYQAMRRGTGSLREHGLNLNLNFCWPPSCARPGVFRESQRLVPQCLLEMIFIHQHLEALRDLNLDLMQRLWRNHACENGRELQPAWAG